jgi:hypothetical protein
MPETPPPSYAVYPRPGLTGPDSADRLQALAEGYFGLNRLFGICVGINLLFVFFVTGASALQVSMTGWILTGLVYLPMLVLLIHGGSFVEKIGYGRGWSRVSILAGRVLFGLNFFCCGVLGFIVLQNYAADEMKKYGLRQGFLGLQQAAVDEKVAELRRLESPTPPEFH